MTLADIIIKGLTIGNNTHVCIREDFHVLAHGNWYEDRVLEYLDCRVESVTWEDNGECYIDIKRTPNLQMEFEDFIEKIRTVIEENMYIDKRYDDGAYGFEIYADYDDNFSVQTLKEFMETKSGLDDMMDVLYEWAEEYKMEYGLSDLKSQIGAHLSEEELIIWYKYAEEMDDWLNKNICFYYSEDHFNKDVCVNIMLDTGDANGDFATNNCLNNWSGYNGELDMESPIRWLARQQGKEKEVENAIKEICYQNEDGCYVGRKAEDDSFVESVIQELENQWSCMSGLLFMVRMKLFDLLELRRKLEEKAKGSIVISKDAMCGLFNPWNGGGSILELAPDSDIKIPFENIWDAWIEGTNQHGYDVDEVYGICGSAWDGEINICYETDDK